MAAYRGLCLLRLPLLYPALGSWHLATSLLQEHVGPNSELLPLLLSPKDLRRAHVFWLSNADAKGERKSQFCL